MTRLFITFYLSVLAVLAAAWYIHGAVSKWQFDGEFGRVAEEVHRGGVTLIREKLDAALPMERAAALHALQEQFDYPIKLVSVSDLPEVVSQRITEGDSPVYYAASGEGGCIAAPLNETNEAVRLGPFPAYSHYEQSLAGGMQLAVQEFECADDADRPEKLKELQQQFGYDISIVPRAELPGRPGQRIESGDKAVFFVRDQLAFFASPLQDSAQVVQFGPFPNYEAAEQRVWATTLGVVFVLAALAIAVLLRPIARQLRSVENAAHAIAKGDLGARVDENRLTSARPLAIAFNDMATRTESLVRTQRELLQAVSHELRTPLARMRFAIDLIETAESDEERRQRLASLDAATEELDGLVGELLSYVRMESIHADPERQPVDLLEVVSGLISNLSPLYPSVRFTIDECIVNSQLLVTAAPADLQRVLKNLLGNAGRFATSEAKISATSRDGCIDVDVDDDGPGIPETERQRVLDPFVRLDSEKNGSGVGLGLAIVQRILRRHDGTVQILESPSGGCCIRTTWPDSGTPS